jgi:hypothetical protein
MLSNNDNSGKASSAWKKQADLRQALSTKKIFGQ